jgi:ATP-dependent RNA helicase DeaD
MSKPFKINIVSIYGGQSFEPQIRALKYGADIVIGTPGRVLDMLKKGHLKLKQIEYLVLDEADEMLKFGFLEELEDIFKFSNDTKRTLLFSATMPQAIVKLSSKYMKDTHRITIARKDEDVSKIEQTYMTVSANSKLDTLRRIIDLEGNFYGLVFCNTKRQADEIAIKLSQLGYACDSLHGDLTQAAREKVLLKFRNRHVKILVVTDVVARGIDIQKLTHVVNYSPPQDLESYTHRIGRTGRGGESGKAITLVSRGDQRLLRPIEKKFKDELKNRPVPKVDDIIAAKKANITHDFEELIKNGLDESSINMAKSLLEQLNPTEALAAALQHAFSNSLSKENYEDIRTESKDDSDRPFKRRRDRDRDRNRGQRRGKFSGRGKKGGHFKKSDRPKR